MYELSSQSRDRLTAEPHAEASEAEMVSFVAEREDRIDAAGAMRGD